MQYASARLIESERAEVWHIYMADAIRCCTIGLGRMTGTGYPVKRYSDFLGYNKNQNNEQENGEELVNRITERIGIKVIK